MASILKVVKEEKDKRGRVTYQELSNGFWKKQEYDDYGRVLYYENSYGFWNKNMFDDNGRQTYYESSNGYCVKRDFDDNGEIINESIEDISKEENKMANNNSGKIYLEFSSKMVFGERTYNTKEGNEVELANIGFPKASKYNGWYITVNAHKIIPSKYSDKMSFVSYTEDKELTIHKYDKETKTTETEKLWVSDIKKEFDSWKNNDKQNEQEQDIEEDEPDICDD